MGTRFFNQFLFIQNPIWWEHAHHTQSLLLALLEQSNNLEMMEFLKFMAESMEVLRKQNEDLNTRLITVET
jgi:hypothetical protein